MIAVELNEHEGGWVFREVLDETDSALGANHPGLGQMNSQIKRVVGNMYAMLGNDIANQVTRDLTESTKVEGF